MLKAGDMVVLLRCQPGSEAWLEGLRAGAIGTVLQFRPCSCGCSMDTVVKFDAMGGDAFVWQAWLRKIDPPEAGSWDDCVWAPAVIQQRGRWITELNEWP